MWGRSSPKAEHSLAPGRHSAYVMRSTVRARWQLAISQEEAADAGSLSAEAAAQQRMETALDLFSLGLDLLRRRLQRENPGMSADQLEQAIDHWMLTRKGAERGDGPGLSQTWPRTRR